MANILAVDDDTAILTMIRRILEKDGHTVTLHSDPESVEQTELDRFDLILLDVMMPGTDGFVLCEKLRRRVDCPILFLTARAEENSLVYGLEKGPTIISASLSGRRSCGHGWRLICGGSEESILSDLRLKRRVSICRRNSCSWESVPCR